MAVTFAIIALVLGLPVTAIRTVQCEVPWSSGMEVKVTHRYGAVSITGRDQAKVVADAVIRATAADRRRADELVQGITVRATAYQDTVSVNTVYPADLEPTPDMSYEVDLALTVPSSAVVLVRNSFGDITATNLGAPCRLENRFGNVVLDQCRDGQVRNRYGDVRVRHSTGSLAVENSFGSVFLDSVSDRAVVQNRYGDVRGSDMSGVVHVDNRLGTVSAQRNAGKLTVVNCFGDVSARVDDVGLTDLDVVSELGQVELNFGRLLPFRLDGSTLEGAIHHSALPVRVEQTGQHRIVHGALGQGGPVIRLTGAWTDFLIQAEPGNTQER